MVTGSCPASPAFYTRDTGLAVLRFEGADATAFLDAQVTASLGKDASRAACPAALANANGRVLCVFHAWPVGGGWHIAVANSQAAWLQSYLNRFIFRSQVRIAPAPDTELLGLSGTQANGVLSETGLPAPAAGRVAHTGTIDIVGLAGERWLISGNKTALSALERSLGLQARAGGPRDWSRARLAAGEVEIRDETRGRFLPQMLGLVELDAVSFRKGCYPGQEIIARARRGKIKRGLALLEIEPASGKTAEPGGVLEHDGKRLQVLDSIAARGQILVQAVASPSSNTE